MLSIGAGPLTCSRESHRLPHLGLESDPFDNKTGKLERSAVLHASLQ